MSTRKISKYGWVPDLPDKRDKIFMTPSPIPVLPVSIDLRVGMPPV